MSLHKPSNEEKYGCLFGLLGSLVGFIFASIFASQSLARHVEKLRAADPSAKICGLPAISALFGVFAGMWVGCILGMVFGMTLSRLLRFQRGKSDVASKDLSQ